MSRGRGVPPSVTLDVGGGQLESPDILPGGATQIIRVAAGKARSSECAGRVWILLRGYS